MKYLAWSGNSLATTGTPNKLTGKYSIFGKLHVFDTRKERDVFCDSYDHRHNCYPVKTSITKVRKYFLGMSLAEFNNYIEYLISE